jgi:two-component system response regulator AdeR
MVTDDTSGPTATVLVVEDEPNLAEAYAHWLREDHEVHVVHSGEAALELLGETAVDVVLLDRHLPDLTGDEVLVTLRDWGVDARVAMVTAVAPDVDVLELGFDDYLTKPVDEATLRATVTDLLERSSYESLRIELGSLQVRRNVLEVEQSADRLAAGPRYDALCRRIEQLERRVADRRAGVAERSVAGD